MKNQFTRGLALIFVLLSFNSQASFLRVESLGNFETNLLDGSLYYKDESNIFHNPADLYLSYQNGVYFQEDEGGYFKRNGQTFYGLYYGRDSKEFTQIRSLLGGFTAITEEKNNPIELMFSKVSGSAALGGSLSYLNETSQTATTETKISVIDLKLGYTKKKYQVFLNYTLSSANNGAVSAQEYNAGPILSLGYKYDHGKWNSYGFFKTRSAEFGTSDAKSDFAETTFLIGAGRRQRMRNKKLILYQSMSLFSQSSKRSPATGDEVENSSFSLPLQLGFEYKMYQWLTLRSGANYELLKSSSTKTGATETKLSGAELNGPQLGAAINFKNFEIDMLYSAGFDQTVSGNDGITNVGRVGITATW